MDEPPYKRFIIYIACTISIITFLTACFFAGIIIAHFRITPETITLNECFVYGYRIPYIPYIHVYGSLVDCLEEEESSCNPLAVGKAGEIGCMQFMPSTFQTYCVEKYGLLNDIWDCEIQRECADRMIRDGGINHWTTKNKCI